MSRSIVLIYLLLMGTFATWLALFNQPGPYVCAALVIAMTATVALVPSTGRRLYFTGVFIGLVAIVVGLWPTDSGGWCGPVLIPGHGVEAYDGITPASRYFDACDDRALLHACLLLLASAMSALLIGASLRTRFLPPGDGLLDLPGKRQLTQQR